MPTLLDGYERDEDIRVILQLLAQARDASVVRLRILVMGRLGLPICLGFKKMAGGTYQDFIPYKLPKSRCCYYADVRSNLQTGRLELNHKHRDDNVLRATGGFIRFYRQPEVCLRSTICS